MLILATMLMLPWAEAHAVTPTDSVNHLRTLFSELSIALDRFAAGNASLVAVGRGTAVVLFGVLLVWGMIRSWILGQGFAQLMPELVQPLLVLAMTLWAVDHLGPVVRQSVEGLGGVFAEVLGLAGGPPTEVDVLQRMAGAGFDIVAAAPTSGGASWLEALKAIADQTLGFLFRLVAALLLLVAGGLAAGVMVLAKIQTVLAILFAPVMIPWAMWQPSTFLFNAWLGFLIGGAMQGVMAAAMAALSVTMVDKLTILAAAVRTDDNVSHVTYSVIVLMAAFIAYLFTRVPSLAAAMVGGASLGIDRWSSVAAQVSRVLSRFSEAGKRNIGQFGEGLMAGVARGRGAPVAGRTGSGPGAGGHRGASPGSGTTAGGTAAGGRTAGGTAGGGTAAAARRIPRTAAGLTGAAFGALTGVAARALGPPPQRAETTLPPNPPTAPPKQRHTPFRPKASARPVNRPLRDE
jgi:hypothetical protein